MKNINIKPESDAKILTFAENYRHRKPLFSMKAVYKFAAILILGGVMVLSLSQLNSKLSKAHDNKQVAASPTENVSSFDFAVWREIESDFEKINEKFSEQEIYLASNSYF